MLKIFKSRKWQLKIANFSIFWFTEKPQKKLFVLFPEFCAKVDTCILLFFLTSKYFVVPQQASPNLATLAWRVQYSLSWQASLTTVRESPLWHLWYQENNPRNPSPQTWAPFKRPKFAHTTSMLRFSGHSSDIWWFSQMRVLFVSPAVISPIHR